MKLASLLTLATFLTGLPAFAGDYYFAAASAGSNSGADCADAYAYNDGTNGWNTGGKQVAGNTLHWCGSITASANANLLNITHSGTSTSPLTIKFEAGASMHAPYFSSSAGAITGSNISYVVIDGGTNGTISNTANGTNLANHQNSYGVELTSCTNCEIRNLIISNIYVNAGASSGATDGSGANTACILINKNSTSTNIHNNTVSQCKTGIQLAIDNAGDASNAQIDNNSISDMDWGINAGGGDSGDTANNLSIFGNTITNWTNWQFPTNYYHQDGIILFNVGNPTAGIIANIHDNYIYGDLGVGSPTGFVYCADFSSCTIYNNLLVNTGHVIYGIMWLGQGNNFGKNMYVYNNTIVGVSSRDVCIMLNISGTSAIENNICTGPSGMFVYSTYHTTLASFVATVATSNSNDWNVGTGNAWGSQATGSTASYATWKASGYEANSVQTSPNLSSSYQLQSGSPAIGLGANLTGLGITALDTGMGGVARAASGAWDAGAYNFSSGGGLIPPTPPPSTTASVQ